jgi:ABC-type transport system involved in cytochrome c biogenesis permease component
MYLCLQRDEVAMNDPPTKDAAVLLFFATVVVVLSLAVGTYSTGRALS